MSRTKGRFVVAFKSHVFAVIKTPDFTYLHSNGKPMKFYPKIAKKIEKVKFKTKAVSRFHGRSTCTRGVRKLQAIFQTKHP